MNSYSAVLRQNDKLDQATQVLLDIKALRAPQKTESTAQSAKEPTEAAKSDQTKPVANTSSGEKTKSEVKGAPEGKPVSNASGAEKSKSDSNGARETAQK